MWISVLSLWVVPVGWGAPSVDEAEVVLMDFSTPGSTDGWRSIDDRVMGGISQSRWSPSKEGSAIFQGEVSLANNGGFASVRSSTEKRDWSGFRGLVLRVRGDGKRYLLNVKCDPEFDGVSYRASFETRADQWSVVYLPTESFQPVFRGRPVPQAPMPNWKSVYSLGLMISGKQAGPFRLEITSIHGRRAKAEE
jgi:hypothetical protein